MICNEGFYNALRSNGIRFYCGVPDSLLKSICAYIADHAGEREHVIAANEGAAVALAAGYHLATGGVPLVYLQNSGLGNTINPLLSLADPEVYALPMVLLVGWRGEPGVPDEPQHRKQGRVQNSMLDAMELPWHLLDSTTTDAPSLVAQAALQARQRGGPVALVVRKNTFEPYTLAEQGSQDHGPQNQGAQDHGMQDQGSQKQGDSLMRREEAIARVLERLGSEQVVVSTTGMPSREVYEYRAGQGHGHQNDFLTVGAMGHASQIALGIAMNQGRPVCCLDGDGATLMHMGSLAIAGQHAPANFRHIVLNNAAHDSVGGQPTVAGRISLAQIARSCGYKAVWTVESAPELSRALDAFLAHKGPVLLEIRVQTGARADLGRPKTSPAQNKLHFMRFLGN